MPPSFATSRAQRLGVIRPPRMAGPEMLRVADPFGPINRAFLQRRPAGRLTDRLAMQYLRNAHLKSRCCLVVFFYFFRTSPNLQNHFPFADFARISSRRMRFPLNKCWHFRCFNWFAYFDIDPQSAVYTCSRLRLNHASALQGRVFVI